MPQEEILRTKILDNVAVITFGHPAGNSFPLAQLDRLTQELKELQNNEKVSIILLQSEGTGAFCAGASFNELLEVSNLIEGTRFFSGFANVINAIRKSGKIVIGRIHGKAVGGGVGLAAACDYAFATKESSIKLSEIAIGIGPFVIEPVVSRKIGKTAMADMALEPAEWKSAEWAFQKGLYARVFDSIEEMDVALNQFIDTLKSYNPEALFELRKTLWEETEHWDTLLYERAAISGKLVLSDFTKNALKRFQK